MKHRNRTLEEDGCRVFVCPNINKIFEYGKKLNLSNETICVGKCICTEFIKRTYASPIHTSMNGLLAASLFIASRMSVDRAQKMAKEHISDDVCVSVAMIRKHTNMILETLDIEWRTQGHGNFIQSETWEHWENRNGVK